MINIIWTMSYGISYTVYDQECKVMSLACTHWSAILSMINLQFKHPKHTLMCNPLYHHYSLNHQQRYQMEILNSTVEYQPRVGAQNLIKLLLMPLLTSKTDLLIYLGSIFGTFLVFSREIFHFSSSHVIKYLQRTQESIIQIKLKTNHCNAQFWGSFS